ncbi:hypothetical protein Csa_016197 [Cucumis sativus]|uniref:Uncharacterized protein n=1 Tax=Cucumis sativus TaxID=3659 RepID=A0A0A0K407_CUCSA|nr:hypothetical protein Csa_016197 [Cucumis sativus]
MFIFFSNLNDDHKAKINPFNSNHSRLSPDLDLNKQDSTAAMISSHAQLWINQSCDDDRFHWLDRHGSTVNQTVDVSG